MQVAPAAVAAPVSIEQFDVVRVDLLNESPRNARKYFDPAKLAELVESVKQHGVVTPLLVREMKEPGRATLLEIIDGARRYRAAVAAGVSEVAAKIITCSDQEAMELGAISNLQREDIHPLDEALGFRQLIEMSGYTVPQICARIGKGESYVYQRLKLTDLVEKGREMLWADEISLAVALLVARIPAKLQQEIIKAKWPLENARRAQDWLDRNVYLRLNKVLWQMGDATLVPAAGSCDACPKRTGFTPALFPEVEEGDTCTDPACFNSKKSAFVEIKKAKVKAKDPDVIEVSGEYRYGTKGEMLDRSKYNKLTAAEAKQTEGAQKALVVDGEDAGKTIWIKPVNTGGYQKSAKEKEADRKKKLEDKIEAEVADRCLDEMLSKARLSSIPDDCYRLLAKKMLDRLSKDGQRRLAKSWDVEPRKISTQYGGSYVDVETPLHERIDDMNRSSLFVAMVDMACRVGHSGEPMPEVFAEWFPVDRKRVEAAVREEFAVYDKPKGKPQPKKVVEMPAEPAPPKPGAKKAAKKGRK